MIGRRNNSGLLYLLQKVEYVMLGSHRPPHSSNFLIVLTTAVVSAKP